MNTTAPTLRVVIPGGAHYQDLGRLGLEQSGLSTGGTMDRFSAQIASLLVGNPRAHPHIEVGFAPCEFEVLAPTLIAAVGPGVLRIDNVVRTESQPQAVWPGQRVVVSPPGSGSRTPFAVRGMNAPGLFAGSVAPDPLIGRTSALHTGEEVHSMPCAELLLRHAFEAPLWHFPQVTRSQPSVPLIPITPGPDAARCALPELTNASYVVAPDSNAIGLRLIGPAPTLSEGAEPMSRGVPVGAVEVTPSDELVVLHRSRYVTAGYPVVAVVTQSGLDALGQVQPGSRLRFELCTVDDALREHRANVAALDLLEQHTRRAFTALL